MGNARLDKAQAGVKTAGRNINNLRYADDTTLMAESKEELKRLLKVKEESEKAVLKLNIQNTKIRASSPITSWQIDGETMEIVRDYIFSAPKSLQMVTAAMKLKTLAPWNKSYDQPRRHIKSRDINLPTKVCLVIMKLLSRVRLFATPWTVAYYAPPSMGFSRQQYWSGLPFLALSRY